LVGCFLNKRTQNFKIIFIYLSTLTFTYDITPFDHFHKNIYKAVCLHVRLYCGVDVTVIANEVKKFGQIFPIHRRRKYKDIK
jgi:hypothetical protein